MTVMQNNVLNCLLWVLKWVVRYFAESLPNLATACTLPLLPIIHNLICPGVGICSFFKATLSSAAFEQIRCHFIPFSKQFQNIKAYHGICRMREWKCFDPAL